MRLTFNQIYNECEYDDQYNLNYTQFDFTKGSISKEKSKISLFYFRYGYQDTHFKSEVNILKQIRKIGRQEKRLNYQQQ